jgi:hypothetical protein
VLTTSSLPLLPALPQAFKLFYHPVRWPKASGLSLCVVIFVDDKKNHASLPPLCLHPTHPPSQQRPCTPRIASPPCQHGTVSSWPRCGALDNAVAHSLQTVFRSCVHCVGGSVVRDARPRPTRCCVVSCGKHLPLDDRTCSTLRMHTRRCDLVECCCEEPRVTPGPKACLLLHVTRCCHHHRAWPRPCLRSPSRPCAGPADVSIARGGVVAVQGCEDSWPRDC